MSVQIFIPYPNQILYTNGRRSTGRSILLIIPTYLTVILLLNYELVHAMGAGEGGWGWEWFLLLVNVVNDVICCDVKMLKKKKKKKKKKKTHKKSLISEK